MDTDISLKVEPQTIMYSHAMIDRLQSIFELHPNDELVQAAWDNIDKTLDD